MQNFTVITTYTDGVQFSNSFPTAREAERFACEEAKWENTARVQCEALNLDYVGDFAIFHQTN
jgi:hypothetical protein